MPGFEFRYRLNGGRPTVRELLVGDAQTLGRGDMVNWADGRVHLGVTGDQALVGAAQGAIDGEGEAAVIRVVTDSDAVYAVDDGHARAKGDRLELAGSSGTHGVCPSAGSQLVVVLDSAPDAPTLVRISEGSHHRHDDEETPDRLTGGELNAAIARSVVRYHNEHLGRGPTRARAFYRDNLVIVVLQDALTKAERSLAASGREQAVRQLREAFDDTIRADLIATVEELTGCKVEAFMSTVHLDPDYGAEVFVLDRPVGADSVSEG